MTTPRACLLCRALTPIEAHHVTGRDGNGEHFDPDLLVDLCQPCHDQVHILWDEARISDALDLAPSWLRKQRALALLDVLADQLEPDHQEVVRQLLEVLAESDASSEGPSA